MDTETNDEEFIEPIPAEVHDEESDVAEYKILTYGADYTLEILSKKINEGEIVIPSFQRKYIWSKSKASKLIESFLLGLPVPQIFLYREDESQNLLVVDGQQRLKSINYFFRGEFDNGQKFHLQGVHQKWEGLDFEHLSQQDKRKLLNCVMRATIFEQRMPEDNNSSMFHIFERLNSGGMALSPQEIRNCIYSNKARGDNLIDVLNSLNQKSEWRIVLNKPQEEKRMRDVELIIRFLALFDDWRAYEKPMKDFLNKWMKGHRRLSDTQIDNYTVLFTSAIGKIHNALGNRAFRLKTTINTPVFDSVCVAIANSKLTDPKEIAERYGRLLEDSGYQKYITGPTTDADYVGGRIKVALRYFSE